MSRPSRPRGRTLLRHYLFAMLIAGVAVVIRAVVQPLLGDALPFVFAFPATVLTSLLWGVGPGVATASLCAIGVWLPDIPPTIPEAQQSVELGWYAVSSLFTSILCGRLRGVRSFDVEVSLPGALETPLSAWLKAVLWGALLVPTVAFVAASWWSLDRAEAESQASLSHASELALRHAQRAFEVAREIALRADQATQMPDQELRARESEIHLRLSDMAAGLTAVVNTTLWDAAGNALARSDRYPVGHDLNNADRAYFQQQRDHPVALGISTVLIGRMTGKEILNATVRRHSADGSFNGIVSVSLSPAYFAEYYRSLASEEPTLATFALVRSDGSVLAKWPDLPGAARYMAAGGAVMDNVTHGVETMSLRVDDSATGPQMVAIKRVGDLPLYVVTGISRDAMLAGWGRFVGVLAAILVPVTLGLVYVTWIALRKTRREEAVSRLLQDEIHARAEAERRVLEAQKLETLSFVTGGVAHDFNNLLAIITSSLHVHKLRYPEAAEDKTLAAISRSVQSGVRLTRQLLSFSKKQALRPEVVQFQTWLPQADALMRSSLGSAAVWTAQVDDDTRPVKVDIGELELALINVVLNAKLAMPSGGSLHVHVSNDEHAPPEAPMVIVCIVDSGDGIAPDVLPRVLEPFFTTRQKGVGSGLGLSQVNNFCIASGGRASIESVLGKGTTVCMHLPAFEDGLADIVDGISPAVTRLDAGLLLVEDNDEVAKITEQMLSSSGLDVARVSNAKEALAYLGAVRAMPDLVLSDIAMPGEMNGIALAIELQRRYPNLPVMLNTGYAEQIEEATARGFKVFQKPLAPEVLLAELSAMLAAAHAKR